MFLHFLEFGGRAHNLFELEPVQGCTVDSAERSVER